MGSNVVYRYSPALAPLGSFAGTNWARPHGIAISPHNGHILVVDGAVPTVSEFDPSTFVELNPSWVVPQPQLKIVDIAFLLDVRTSVQATTWSRMKAGYR